MLIKEFRIVMPMSIEEYQIGQLYTIQKKSRLESEGVGGGVEIIENRPFDDENGKGQYTLKVYHVDQKLPQGLKHLTKLLFPASALIIEEKGWNMYPYTKTQYRNQLFKKFSIDIETKFLSDLGDQENVFKLNKSELSNRIVEHIDMVNDPIQAHDYKENEDLKVFKSIKNNRGPLNTNWLDELKKQVAQKKTTKYMCAYKLCRIECVFWGLQARLEKTIIDSIRNMLLITHRQAWCWQDEYYGLSLDDIRKLEEQAQEELKRKMNSNYCNLNKDENNNNISSLLHESTASTINNSTNNNFDNERMNDVERKNSISESLSYYYDIENVEDTSVHSNDEFFDAISQVSFNIEPKSHIPSTYHSSSTLCASEDLIEKQYLEQAAAKANSFIISNNATKQEFSKDYFILVVHGGDVLNSDDCKLNDFQNVKATFDRILKANWSHVKGKLFYRLVSCENLCKDVLKHLSSLSPYAEQSTDDLYYSNDNLPFNVLPLFLSLNQKYKDKLGLFVNECNRVYHNFLNSQEGSLFNGEIIVIGDSIGSILAYDALALESSYETNIDSNNSSTTTLESYPSSPSDFEKSLPPTPLHEKPCINLQQHHSFKSESSSRPQLSLNDNLIRKSHSLHRLSVFSQSNGSLSTLDCLDFKVSHFFVFGSPLGLILAYRNYGNLKLIKPKCKQFYNLFHLNDPVAIRIEPLLIKNFRNIQPYTIPRYLKSPYGDGSSILLNHYEWWGDCRIDYVLYSPEKLITNLPRKSLPYLFHSSYWESTDVVSFILNTIFKLYDQPKTYKNSLTQSLKIPSEKWMNLSNRLTLKNSTPNHRANDVIFLEDSIQIITGKFLYAVGPLDLALSNEKVDIYILKNSSTKEWQLLATEVTDKNGRLKYEIPTDKRLLQGTYSVKMVVRYDKTSLEFNLSVLPENTDTVVFSITGSFAANISLSGSDPKVRAGAVDIARHWQDQGYLIIYISARPDKQKAKMTRWLAQHNFPLGMVFFSDGIRPDPIKQKLETLKSLVNNTKLKIRAAYGSQKDISAYSSLGLSHDQIFITGKSTKRFAHKAQTITDGYLAHLNYLKTWLCQANGNARLVIQRTTFNRQNSINQSTLFSNLNSEISI